jgi:hypothetical protein
MPKRRIPVAPPGIRHKSKKDYKRVKKITYPEHPTHVNWDEWDEWAEYCIDGDCIVCRGGYDGTHNDDLLFLLNRFGLTSAETRRLVSYG